jgi:hypothetical protein
MLAMCKRVAGLAGTAVLLAAPAAGAWSVSAPITFRGMCDASGAVALSSNLFVVADDEENQLRLYRTDPAGLPERLVDLSSVVQVSAQFPEADLEGAAWLGERIFWIGSHGRNSEGKQRPNRHCFFATEPRYEGTNVALQPVGVCYRKLLKDLSHDARLKPFGLTDAAKRPPKSKGALNIEGLCAGPADSLFIGFRNPIPRGRALIVPLLNPNHVVSGKSAKFGPPILLDLGGLGVRDLASWQGQILILAGPYDTEKNFRLFLWRGGADPPQAIPDLDFGNLTPEALVVFPDSPRFLVLSDDGTYKIQGIDCKHLPDHAQRRFQAVWVSP